MANLVTILWIISGPSLHLVYARSTTVASRNTATANANYWGNEIPYNISASFGPKQRQMLVENMERITELSRGCIRFVEKTTEQNHLYFAPGSGCSSHVGKQLIRLGPSCFTNGILQHVIMHALGFYHEQNRQDRDNYVDIFWDNIRKGLHKEYRSKFISDKVRVVQMIHEVVIENSLRKQDDFGLPYDFDSILHSEPRDYAINHSKPTMAPKSEFAEKSISRIGQRNGLSYLDAIKIQIAYGCLPRVSLQKIEKILAPLPSTRPALSSDWENLIDPEQLEIYKNGKSMITVSGLANKNAIEGDIEGVKLNQDSGNATSIIETVAIWPSHQSIPYEISRAFMSRQRDLITAAMDGINAATHGCISFSERSGEDNFIRFVAPPTSICQSYVGMKNGGNMISLGSGCFKEKGVIEHEILHSLGLFHEQTRPDRDLFVNIFYDNMLAENKKNFVIQPQFKTLGLPYDVNSVMHYSWNDFANNTQKPTILPKMKLKDAPPAKMGQRGGLSVLDVAKLEFLYGCTPEGPTV